MPAQFEKWLRQGSGRAAVLVRDEPLAAYRDALFDACTHDLRYDRQCEEVRGFYLANLIQLSAEPRFFRGGVLDALTSEARELAPHDVQQMFAVARHWAAGDQTVRQLLYDVFARDAFDRAEIGCAEYLVKMDGLHALLFVLPFLQRSPECDRQWQFDLLTAELEERDGEESAGRVLAAAAAGRPDLERLWSGRTEPAPRPKPAPPFPYAEVQRQIAGQAPRVTALASWGRTATDRELSDAAADLLAEADEARLHRYLTIFRNRRFPGPHERLQELARRGDWRLSHAAVAALNHVDDPDLRSLALELLATADRCDLGVGLLTGRSQTGDYRLIEQALDRSLSDYVYHSLGLSALRFSKANLSEEAAAALALLYENGPCSMCRASAVQHLADLHCLSAWMRDECRHDADSSTRALAAESA